MRPTIEQLHTPDRYKAGESVQIDEMNAFVQRELGMTTQPRVPGQPPNRWFAVSVMAMLAVAGGVFGYSMASMLKQGSGSSQLGGLVAQTGIRHCGLFCVAAHS